MKYTIAIVCLAVAALTGCANHEVAAKAPVTVRTVAVQMATDATDVRYSGVVAPDTQADLAFRVSGYVEQIGSLGGREISEGDVVPAGAVLARLRPAEYQSRAAYAVAVASDAEAVIKAQQAQLADAQASLTQATRDFDRASSLYAEKAMTKADYEAVETRRDSAKARRDATQSQIASLRARLEAAGAQRGEAALTLSDTSLVAPFPGVIVAKRVARGSFASPGAPAFVLADIRMAKVSFGVPDIALGSFSIGGSFPVQFEAMPGREFLGRVSIVAPAADPTSRVFPVQVTIPNPDRALKIGMVATVVVRMKDARPAPVIPLAAVVKADGGYGVYRVDKGDGAERVRLERVTLGAIRGNSVQIAAGLSAGERIVAAGGLQLADGEAVRIVP